MKKILKKISSLYVQCFADIRSDIPQIALFLNCLLGLAIVGVTYGFFGKAGAAGSGAFYVFIRAWFKMLHSKKNNF